MIAEPAAAREAPQVAPRGRLFRKYVISFVALVSIALIVNAAIEALFSSREQRRLLVGIQTEQAQSAATKISQFVREIERQLGWLAQLPPDSMTRDDQRIDAIRLMRLTPAIAEVAQADSAGREQLRVSRYVRDVVGSGNDLSATPAFKGARERGFYYGPIYFFRETEPFMTIALAGRGTNPSVTIAEVNLRFIWDLVSQIKVGASGKAFVTDGAGRLIAHPDLWPVLRNTDLGATPRVRTALSGAVPARGGEIGEDLAGRRVLSAYAPVNPLGWFVFVELPVDEAYASIYASIRRSAVLLSWLLVCAGLAALVLSRRMTGPIHELTRGAARIGDGDLEQRLAIRTGDELEALGEQFNRMAGQLSESYTTLERKVVERTAELAQARDEAWEQHANAQRARQAAERANEAKSRFLAVVSHELRTPLNGVIGVLQLLDNGSLDTTQRRQLRTASASGDTLLALIDTILEYARLEAGTETLEERDFRLDQVLTSAVDLMRPQAEAKGIKLTLALRGDLAALVYGDPVRLNRVLLNLVGNAVKFTRQGEIEVDAEAASLDGTMVLRVAVRDTGIGIAPAVQERIFEDFRQADDSIARRFGGTGLGLAISRRLAELMGGGLTVESAEGAGSTFRLTLQFGRARGVAAAAEPSGPDRQLAVLLVDDDPINRDIGLSLLERLGHRAAVAENGVAAIALARDGAFDAILMDLHMPDMDGLSAAAEVRKLPLAKTPRLIVLTADVSHRSRERIARAGIRTVVSKPVLLESLRAALTQPENTGELAMVVAPDVPEVAALIDDDFLADQRILLGAARLRSLTKLFGETSAELLRTIASAARTGDRVSVQRAAHQLGSAASALALSALFNRCTALENDMVTIDAAVLHEAADDLAALRDSSLAALTERLAEGASAALV
jgi:signal transduction histidine kinase/ActR/RegA family two-component response regulator/HPt (histidine-containing phosphotransfer) domain-containing protein